jgi:ferredoxin-NADP reductase
MDGVCSAWVVAHMVVCHEAKAYVVYLGPSSYELAYSREILLILRFGQQEANIPDGSKVAAVLCGQKEMCQAVTSILTDRGVAKENILLNF